MFRLLVQSVRDYAIFLLDPAGRVMTWNEGAQRLKGYEPADIVGKHFSVFYPPQEVRAGKPERALRAARLEGRWEDEGWRIRKDGNHFWANVVITALNDDSGELVGFAKVTRDLTERREADEERSRLLQMEQESRREAERTLAQLRTVRDITETALRYLELDDLVPALAAKARDSLNVDTVAIFVLDDQEDGTPTLRLRAAVGLGNAESTSRHDDDAFAACVASSRAPIVVEDAAHSTLVGPNVVRAGLKSVIGVPLRAEEKVIGVLEAGSRGALGFSSSEVRFVEIVADALALAIDHASLVFAAGVAREEAEIAEATIRAQDEFLSIAAHELKTPITSLRLASQMLVRQIDKQWSEEESPVERALMAIDMQSANLARLISQLLDRIRLQNARLELQISETDIIALISEVVERARLATDKHQFEIRAPGALVARVDGFRFEQVVTNLVDNAVKFSPNGGEVRIEIEREARGFRLAVQDNGVGVPHAHRERLFERLYQAHRDQHMSGMGLGLYISREIVELHSGSIRAEFPSTGGTRMVVTIPGDGKDES